MKTTCKILVLTAVIAPVIFAGQARADQPLSTEAMFITSDTDRSGSISAQEFDSYLSQTAHGDTSLHQDFSLMDLNKDNKLTLSEMEVGEEMYPLAFR